MDFTKYDYLIAIDNLWVPFITGKSSNGLQWKMVVGKLFIAAQARSNMETLSCCDNFFYLNLTLYLNRPQLTLEHFRGRLLKIAHEMIEVTYCISANSFHENYFFLRAENVEVFI